MPSGGRWALLAGAMLVAGGGLVALFVRGGDVGRPDRVEAQVGAATLVYPPSYARFRPGRSGGNLDRLELALTFPDLRGAGAAAAEIPSEDDVDPNARQLVFVTLRPEDEAAAPADRTEALYARFLQSDVWQEENGLVMRRFETGSPYQNEELHFVPPEGRVFAARCMRPTQPPSDLPSTCLTALRLDGLDVDIRFSPTLLGQWDALVGGVQRLVLSFLKK